jgi:HPt (histidine-containing phosphotransfer) domain-containing protein
MSLNANMKLIAQSLNKQDWNEMKLKAHSLKGACGYVGASRLHYACYFIQEAFEMG